MRRGLGTNDEAVADAFVAQMNEILANESWWNAARRVEANALFHKVIVDAFFDEIQVGRQSAEELRDAIIKLPDAKDGYARVLLVGTTGAGKTSLVRQLIGSDPDEDRFPSTAPAKTTIADLEAIQADGDFRAAVTFFSEFQVQTYVEECLLAACFAAFEGADDAKVAERLLNHSDQKFRLSYVLGSWPSVADADDDEFSFSARSAEKTADPATSSPLDPALVEKLHELIDRVKALTVKNVQLLRTQLGAEFDDFLQRDLEAVESWFEENVCDATGSLTDEFFGIAHDVMDEIRARFDSIKDGTLVRARSGWPESWSYATGERSDFIRQVRWFSSNYWPEFGRLLTPIVQGIRVRGPLWPSFSDAHPPLVLIDGQGLGHTPDSSTSVPLSITKRFGEVDVILLVDNAQQPMLAAPQSVLRAAAASGYHHKLAVAFTHFDLIEGDNLRTLDTKRAHVMASVTQAISSLRDTIGTPVAKAIETALPSRCFMLGGIDRRIDVLPPKAAVFVRGQLLSLTTVCENSIAPQPEQKTAPVYDPTGIGFAVRDASLKFLGPWSARLGLASYSGANREHYNRIKALNRRIAGGMANEYDSLRPVADFVARLSESISQFLDKPIDWTNKPVEDAEAEAAISLVRRNVSNDLHRIALHRLIEDHLTQWRQAYDLRGAGSTNQRSLALKQIYDLAAPLPDTVMTEGAATFVTEIRRLLETAIKDAGGEIRLAQLT
jgi:predicted GTPase